MQLKTHAPIRSALATATIALLGAHPTQAASNHSETSLLFYSEQDRVRATEAIYNFTRELKNGSVFGLRVTYDGLTGASPTGASPSKHPQTLTRSSGGGQVTVGAGKLPTDGSFKDTRFAGDVSLTKQLNSITAMTLEAHGSSEHDYKSIGLTGGLNHDFNNRNTTLGFMTSYTHDISSPLGGVPVPLSVSTNLTPGGGDDDEGDDAVAAEDDTGAISSLTKNIYEFLVSVTQVLNRKTLLRLSFTYNHSSGYLTDPYKVVSVVQPADSTDAGEPVENRFESRPDVRNKKAAFAEIRRYVGIATVDVSYRYFWDDWGVTAHSVEFLTRIKAGRMGSFQPHLRWYHQDRADFSRPFLIQGAPLPEFVSADARLATFDAFTYGLGYTFRLSTNSQLTLTGEYYTQRGDKSPPESFGPLLNYSLFPDLKAVMVRVGLSHDF